ncbi:MAG TPA: AAA family ATPase [Chloroflexota bacterium]|nr:AAA family ATPase [Chloroflexota bacterium]
MLTAPTVRDASLRLELLGGFRAEREGSCVLASAWLRRGSARTLVKLVALHPQHKLHREQILDMLWPDVELDSALNRFAKALHAARRALEPTLTARAESSYLRMSDDVLSLDPSHVWVDIDEFESAARLALETNDVDDLHQAKALYRGKLLPEDEYEEWTLVRREDLARLHEQILEALARNAQRQRKWWQAAQAWKELIALDPTREGASRELMRLHALKGDRALALRQYQELRAVLANELQAEPEAATEALYREIRSGLGPYAVSEISGTSDAAPLPGPVREQLKYPLVGRAAPLEHLGQELDSAEYGDGRAVFLLGGAGMGKTRLLAEVASAARQRRALVLWGSGYADKGDPAFAPLVDALEGYLATRPLHERGAIAAQFPLLSRLIPCLAPMETSPPLLPDPAVFVSRLFAACAALLTDLSSTRPLVLILDALQNADETTIRLVYYLARLASDHPWLLIGAFRSEELALDGCPARTLLRDTVVGPSCRLTLASLTLEETETLLCGLLQTPDVDPALLHNVFLLTRGNPRFVHEIVHSFQESGDLHRTNGLWTYRTSGSCLTPPGIRELVAGFTTSLAPAHKLVLDLASALEREWRPDRLVAAAEIAFGTAIGAGSALETLDRALMAGIIEDRGETYAFAYPIVQQAIFEQLPSHRRLQYRKAVWETSQVAAE